jgi:hypothetical protein
MEELRSLAFASLPDGGSTLNSSGNITFTGSPVSGYSITASLADSDQIGKTVSYDVRWNITTVNGLKKIRSPPNAPEVVSSCSRRQLS